jgi:hypothetical protein
MATELLNAIHPLIRNDTHSAEYDVAPGETMNRQALERHVLADLFGRDARFAPRSRKWARLALDIKTMTLDGASSEMILEELEERMMRIEADTEPDREPVSETENEPESDEAVVPGIGHDQLPSISENGVAENGTGAYANP